MVMQFLPMVIGGLKLAGQLSALKNQSQPAQQTAGELERLQALSGQSRLLRALLNPDDTVFKNIRAGEEGFLRGQTQTALRDLINADRRSQLMGRRSFFNPERRDESISRFMSQSTALNQEQARMNTIDRILKSISGYGNLASGYGNTIENQMLRQQREAERKPAMLGGIADILGQFGKGGSFSNILAGMGGGA